MLGVLAGYWKPDWKEAQRHFQLAMAREPVPWHVRSWHATFYLRPLGGYVEARKQSERAREDNPLSQVLHWLSGNILAGTGSETEALEAYERAVELDPHFWIGH